ncbi:MAG: hypothetical protein H6892_10610 [Brucellaceae bacterium]|nr:hypothetical protein [Brucellaceae bacterium]
MSRFSFAVASVLAVAALGLAGCQSGSGVDALDLNSERDPVKLSELRMYCPSVQLREGTAYFNTYERGGKDDATRVVYQASIADVTRQCSKAGGMLNIRIAIAGRIVPGPKGKAGTITMPIRVAVVQGSDVLYSQLYKHPVNIGDTIGATQFIFSDAAFQIPTPATQNVLIFAGYDEGPYDTP